VIEAREYLDRSGRSPYADWFDRLSIEAAAKVVVTIVRIQQGNFSSVKGIGSGVYEYRIDFGPGYRIYFGKDGDSLVILVGGGSKKRRPLTMPLTKDFKETIRARVERDPNFRKALLREGLDSFLSGDVETGKLILRDFINATVGFFKLGHATDRSAKSLMRMLGPAGNPQAKNLFEIVSYLQRAEGVRFEVRSCRTASVRSRHVNPPRSNSRRITKRLR
jgi:putative addiction module killer protein